MNRLSKIQQLTRLKRISFALILLFVCQIMPMSIASADVSTAASTSMTNSSVLCPDMEMSGMTMTTMMASNPAQHMHGNMTGDTQPQAAESCCSDCSCFVGSCSMMLTEPSVTDSRRVIPQMIVNGQSAYPSIALKVPLHPPSAD